MCDIHILIVIGVISCSLQLVKRNEFWLYPAVNLKANFFYNFKIIVKDFLRIRSYVNDFPKVSVFAFFFKPSSLFDLITNVYTL